MTVLIICPVNAQKMRGFLQCLPENADCGFWEEGVRRMEANEARAV